MPVHRYPQLSFLSFAERRLTSCYANRPESTNAPHVLIEVQDLVKRYFKLGYGAQRAPGEYAQVLCAGSDCARRVLWLFVSTFGGSVCVWIADSSGTSWSRPVTPGVGRSW